nr:MAG TPA: hypothetical protein [Caudoviricetes sp.]
MESISRKRLTNLVLIAQGKPRIKSYHFNIKTKGAKE